MRFTITTALFVLFVSTALASPLPIDSSLEGRNAPAARSAAVSVERRTELTNLEIPNKRQEGNKNADWKRNAGVASPLS
ncbi:hypothetical protein M378DRAFT_169789 [Amanita muscaria Koide BX008]|uniref:Uncharacterized protein n=1 Tax=Amanita muscaria (strain Koide BX008) TaxID=946122 RepID=A0A0C2S8M6_AMAMK|nr:hypothetical protein M378DRAFT_169789 [Amanita muscaria Koide BX008]